VRSENTTDAQTFGAALRRIYALEHARDVEALIRMLDNSLERNPESTVRAAAAAALGRLADAKAGEALLATANDRSAEVRYAVVRALGLIKWRTASADLIIALNDDSLDVRRAAAISLGLLGGEEAIPALHEALDSPDAWTRLYAAEALAAIGDSSLSQLLPSAIRREARLAVARRKRWRKLQTIESPARSA